MKTNAELEADVRAELDRDPRIKDAQEIAVGAKRGIVRLRGTVGSLHQRMEAERSAMRVPGVASVDNVLRVRPLDEYAREDAEIRGAALQALQWHATVPADTIDVKVRGGRVTLTGSVSWKYEKDAAEAAVSVLTGVVSVRDEIEVAAPANELDGIYYRIEDAFWRSARRRADAIRISVDNGHVILEGDVLSWAEHDVAIAAASAAPGVRDVEDRLSVVG